MDKQGRRKRPYSKALSFTAKFGLNVSSLIEISNFFTLTRRMARCIMQRCSVTVYIPKINIWLPNVIIRAVFMQLSRTLVISMGWGLRILSASTAVEMNVNSSFTPQVDLYIMQISDLRLELVATRSVRLRPRSSLRKREHTHCYQHERRCKSHEHYASPAGLHSEMLKSCTRHSSVEQLPIR